MTMLPEQLADAVSAVTKYYAALVDCSKKIEIVIERLVHLELSSVKHIVALNPDRQCLVLYPYPMRKKPKRNAGPEIW